MDPSGSGAGVLCEHGGGQIHEAGGGGSAGEAKHVFQAHGVDNGGRMVLRRKLRRHEVGNFFSKLEPCVVGMKASGSAHYWARVLRAAGHTVRPMAPQFVKPYLKSNKNDANDAEAIAEVVMRPNMRFVSPKPPS